jgi:hypothetical protein
MGKRTQWLSILSIVAGLVVTVAPAEAATISLGTIYKYFDPDKCTGASKGGCPVTFAGDVKGLVYLTVITYDPKKIQTPGQKVTLDLGYRISPGGSLVECNGATTSGRGGKCNDGSTPAKNNVAGVLTFPKNDTNIYFFTGDMEKDFTDNGGFGEQPSYVQFNWLYSELGITTPDLSIGTTPIEISTKGVTGYFRTIQGGKNERLFLTVPVLEPSTWMLMVMGLGGIGIVARARAGRPISGQA